MNKPKIQQFYVLKFDSNRLKNSKYNININLETGRKNNEVISLSDSELLRQYRSLLGIKFSYGETRGIISRKNQLNKEKNKIKNREELKNLQERIDKDLFVENIVMIKFNNVSHYKTISKSPLVINGKNFIRLMCGAGNARKSVALFAEEQIANKLTEIFDAGRDLESKLVLGKFTSYQALFSSQTQEITQPRFCVVGDYEFEKDILVDWVYEDEKKKNQVVEKKVKTKFTPFDGQGIVSPDMAKIWSDDLFLNHVPSAFIIRSAYLKGQCVVFDFKLFAEENEVSTIVDVWGEPHEVDDLDAIISASQFKLWQSYSSMKHYLEECKKRNFNWGVSKYTHSQEKNFFMTSYQYLQCLDLSDRDIEKICEPTLKQIRNISFDDHNSSIIYQMGEAKEENIKDDFFNNIEDNVLKALLINKKTLNDVHIKSSLFKKLNKKIKESYIGSLVANGNYQTAISDTYAFCEFVFGLEVKGLLSENEYYCNYWNEKGVDKVIGLRSPLTFKSEVNLLNLKNDEKLRKWYSYNTSGIVYNIHGVDCILHGGSDYDGDIIATTDNKQFLKGRSGGLPISHEKKSAPKNKINTKELYLSDIKSFGTKVGLITNNSTSLFSLLSKHEKGTIEYQEIMKRLKVCRVYQESEIDKAKGVLISSLEEWGRWQRIKPSMTEREKQEAELHNKLLLDKRPDWFRYLYPRKMKEIKKHDEIYENYCQAKFGYSLKNLLSNSLRNEKEEQIFQKYIKYSPLIYNGMGTMDRISRYMQKSISEHKISMRQNDFDYLIYVNSDIRKDRYKQDKMREILRDYNSFKRNLRFSTEFQSSEQMVILLRNRAEFLISNNSSELANLAVQITYGEGKMSSFVWDLFSDGLFENLLKNSGGKIEVPVLDDNGDILYLNKKYRLKGIKVNA